MKIKIKKCPPKSGGPKMMQGGGDPLGLLGVSALVSAKNYLRSNQNGKTPSFMSDEKYEYEISNPFDLENSKIYSRKIGSDKFVEWNDTNMPPNKRAAALANLRRSFPDSFTPIEPNLEQVISDYSEQPTSSASFNPYQVIADPNQVSALIGDNSSLPLDPSFQLGQQIKLKEVSAGDIPMVPFKNPADTFGEVMKAREAKKSSQASGSDKSNPLFDMLERNLNDLESENSRNMEQDQASADELFRRKNRLNVGSAITNSLQGIQDTYYEAFKPNTSLLGSKYRRMPLSALEQQAANLRNTTAAMGRELLKEGLRPTEISAVLGNAQGRTAEAESNLRFNFFQKNTDLDRARFGELQNRVDASAQNTITARNAARDDQNKLLAAQVDNIQTLLDNRDKLITDEHLYGRNVKKGFNDNRMSILQNRLNLYGVKDLADKARADTDKEMSRLAEYFEKYKKEYIKN